MRANQLSLAGLVVPANEFGCSLMPGKLNLTQLAGRRR
jgi:fumarate hydratase class II